MMVYGDEQRMPGSDCLDAKSGPSLFAHVVGAFPTLCKETKQDSKPHFRLMCQSFHHEYMPI